MSDHWELVEFRGGKEPEVAVVGRYPDEAKARSALFAVRAAGAPTEPGDVWDEADYYVRREGTG